MSILKQLQTKLPLFSWEYNPDYKSYSGSINNDTIEKRLSNDLYRFGGIYVYISSRLYGTGKRSFIYATCYQKAEVRPYRCKRTHDVESNKVYVSGKNIQSVVNKLVDEINVNMFSYYLSK